MAKKTLTLRESTGSNLTFVGLLRVLAGKSERLLDMHTDLHDKSAFQAGRRDREMLKRDRFVANGSDISDVKSNRRNQPRRALVLDPTDKGGKSTVPFLSPQWTFNSKNGSFDELRLYLTLFFEGDDGAVHGVGYRYEQPEGPGMHDYFHSQITSNLLDNCDLVSEMSPVPTSIPAMPLLATSPTQLVVCLLVSLYGAPHLHSLKRDEESVPGLAPVLNYFESVMGLS